MLYTTVMETYTGTFKTELFTYPIFDEYFRGMSFSCFDIETLGLSPSRAPVILAGFLDVDPDGNAVNTQYYTETPEDEAKLLLATVKKLNSVDIVVTYNGRSFDLPYIAKRYSMIFGEVPRISAFDLDLYQLVRCGSFLKGVLTGLSQKDVERYMGVNEEREDEISGAESVRLYQEAVLETDPVIKRSARDKILLHNSDDVAQLYRILPIVRQCDLHKAFALKGYPVMRSSLTNTLIPRRLTITRNRLASGKLTIQGTYPGNPICYISYPAIGSPFDVRFKADGTFEIIMPVETRSGAVFCDLSEFLNDDGEFIGYGGYVNGYLILKEKGELNYREINALARKIVQIV